VKRILQLILCVTLLHSVAVVAQQDLQVSSTGPYLDLFRGSTWTGSGTGAVNNNFLFTPQDSNEGVCVYLYNNDSGSHSFTIKASQSGDQRITAYSGNTSKWITTGQVGSTTLTVSATSQVAIFFSIASAAKVAITFSGGSGSGTADAYLVQSQARACGNGQTQFTPTTDVAGYNSYYNSNGTTGTVCVTNPGANLDILDINASANLSFQATYFRWIRITSSAAAQFNILRTVTAGSTCTNVSTVNTNLAVTNFSGSTVTTNCTTDPTGGGTISSVQAVAGVPQLIDFGNDLWSQNSSTNFGLEVTNPGAITGTVCVDFMYSQQ
jgi:hypothetical protein